MKPTIVLIGTLCTPFLALAADLPDVVNANRAATQQMCIDHAADDCVNTVCPNSSDINCTRTCQTTAQAKCKGMTAQ
ncbi:MAG: hypothetical protein NTW94_07620 [Legionellales bacterium]|nr:hypothetical protein [Legionellales bacterium]